MNKLLFIINVVLDFIGQWKLCYVIALLHSGPMNMIFFRCELVIISKQIIKPSLNIEMNRICCIVIDWTSPVSVTVPEINPISGNINSRLRHLIGEYPVHHGIPDFHWSALSSEESPFKRWQNGQDFGADLYKASKLREAQHTDVCQGWKCALVIVREHLWSRRNIP